MKQVLYIAGFLLALLFFSPEKEGGNSEGLFVSPTETVMEENTQTDMQQHIAVLSNDLKNNSLLTSRRTSQSFSQTTTIRLYDGTQRIVQYFRLKGENLLIKVQEQVSVNHIVVYSTLLFRMAHHVFALRKLLI